MSEFDKTVAVIGTGYVGVTTSAILANAGYTVYALDISEERLNALREGKSFFYEKGINPLIKKAVGDKKLIPTSSYKEAISNAKFIFSCVGTPDKSDGSSNLDYVFSAAKETAKYIKQNTLYVQKSTVPVGTGKEVSNIFIDKDVAYTSNPEFLREGTAVLDSLFFDRIVVGGENKNAVNAVLDLYREVEKKQKMIAKIANLQPKSINGEYIATNLDSAELIKVTANAFLALKISFANSIAKLADQTDADVVEVMNAVGADPRIGKSFLNAGRGYGGGCFPKDVSGLILSSEAHGAPMEIMKAASRVNESMAGYIVEKAEKENGEQFKDKKIAVLGLAFKAGTSDARKSPGAKIANILADNGAKVSVYDPESSKGARKELRSEIQICDSVDQCIESVHAVFIATDWPEFKNLDLNSLTKQMSGNLLVDCMNIFDQSSEKLNIIGVGR